MTSLSFAVLLHLAAEARQNETMCHRIIRLGPFPHL